MTDLIVPTLGESISEAVIARWLKQVGERTTVDEPIVDIETDKVSIQLPAPAAGVLAEKHFAEGASVKVGSVIGRIDTAAEPNAQTPQPLVSPAVAPAFEPGPTPSPAQGRAGRASLAPESVPVPERPQAPPPGSEEVVPMSPLRRRIAERLVQARRETAMLTTFNEIDMSSVIRLRERTRDEFQKKHGVRLGFMSFFARAVVAALRDLPVLNAEVRGADIVYKKHYDIGIAIGSGRGLVVPVVRDCDQKSFAQIEREIAALAEKVRENRLALEDLAGGTFTITNGGIYGSVLSTPLINYPQVGILGMHRIANRAVVAGEEVVVRPMMWAALSYDHRIVDGREAVQFLVGVKARVEEPERLLFD